MEKACSSLKNKLKDVSDFVSAREKAKEFLAEYIKKPTAELKKKTQEAISNAKEIFNEKDLSKFEEDVIEKTRELLNEYDDEILDLTGNLKLEKGRIILEKSSVEIERKNIDYFPTVIGEIIGDLNLENVENAEGVSLPQIIRGNLDLKNLTSTEGIDLPSVVKGNLKLGSLTTAKNLNLPREVNGWLSLKNLKSAENINFPNKIGDYLDLNDLKSPKDIDLSGVINIDGNIYLDSFSENQIDKFKKDYPKFADKVSTWH